MILWFPQLTDIYGFLILVILYLLQTNEITLNVDNLFPIKTLWKQVAHNRYQIRITPGLTLRDNKFFYFIKRKSMGFLQL